MINGNFVYDQENVLLTKTHVLVYDNTIDKSEKFAYIKTHFCGLVYEISNLDASLFDTSRIFYLCIDIETNLKNVCQGDASKCVLRVVKELSQNYDTTSKLYQVVSIDEIPINMYDTGVFFRQMFSPDKDYFDLITTQHQFQSLTESNKPDRAFRKGIYLTNVVSDPDTTDVRFNLLRCSTNLDGPTDNFRDTDHEIITKVNSVAKEFFRDSTELNHVLAQVYENHIVTTNGKTREKKAKISRHSDKTKDMPKNALIAFCSFYKGYTGSGFKDRTCVKSTTDAYDYCYNGQSVLTVLRFCLKPDVAVNNMQKQFDVVLYPNSVFVIPLSTNRLYTHEIVPSALPVDKIPTRMGYVVRCSDTKAVYRDGQTYILKGNILHKLIEPVDTDVLRLKELYYVENTTIEMVHYDGFYFSLNKGDYTKPIV